MANYTDIILKYCTWYKGLDIRVVNDPLYKLYPILEIYDKQTDLTQQIFFVEDIPKTFKLIGLFRATT